VLCSQQIRSKNSAAAGSHRKSRQAKGFEHRREAIVIPRIKDAASACDEVSLVGVWDEKLKMERAKGFESWLNFLSSLYLSVS